MSEAVRYDLEEGKEKARRLTIAGPSALMEDVAASSSTGLTNGKINGRRPFTLESVPESSEAVWRFNARAVGKMPEESQRVALTATNGFIGALVARIRKGDAENDPALHLLAYAPNWLGDEYIFHAEVTKPKAASRVVQGILLPQVVGMAKELGIYPWLSKERYDRAIISSVDLEGSGGVSVKLSTHSGIHTMGDRWDPGHASFELDGNNVMNNAEPLIYLAAAVAVARADELAQT